MRRLFINGRICTQNPEKPWARMMAVDDERISYVGDFIDIAADEVVDLNGKMVIPSFVDSHVHPGWIAKTTWHVNMPIMHSVDEIIEFIKSYAQRNPKEEVPFLYIEYYPTDLFGEDGPHKEILDQAVNDRPCLVQDFGEHMSWVNSKMLELMEVNKDTPDPVPGLQMFWRDGDGNPTGWIKEWAWQHHIEKMYKNIGWHPENELSAETIDVFFSRMKEYGIGAVFDGFIEDEAQIKAIYELDCQGKLNCYYDGSIRCDTLENLSKSIKTLREYQEKYSSRHIKIETMKIFVDGTAAGGNVACLEPLSSDPTGKNYGVIGIETQELTEYLLICNKEALNVHLHIIGDRAFRVVCDAVEAARKITGADWQIKVTAAHLGFTDPADDFRPAELGMYLNLTPHWMGGYFGEEAIHYIGYERWVRMHGGIRRLIETGAHIAFSSDTTTLYEFNRANPFFGMQIGNTKVDIEYPLNAERYSGSIAPPADEYVPRDVLLKGYTWGGAKQSGYDNLFGKLEEGKLANFNVLSDNFFMAEADEIKNIKCEMVVFEGKILINTL